MYMKVIASLCKGDENQRKDKDDMAILSQRSRACQHASPHYVNRLNVAVGAQWLTSRAPSANDRTCLYETTGLTPSSIRSTTESSQSRQNMIRRVRSYLTGCATASDPPLPHFPWLRQRTSCMTGRGPCTSGHLYSAASGHLPRPHPTAITDRTHRSY